jgi:hypothetical protein
MYITLFCDIIIIIIIIIMHLWAICWMVVQFGRQKTMLIVIKKLILQHIQFLIHFYTQMMRITRPVIVFRP